MFEHFTEDEIERMSSFTETPAYARTPEQLLPEDAEESGGDTEVGAASPGDATE